jgi:hypothetical protein
MTTVVMHSSGKSGTAPRSAPPSAVTSEAGDQRRARAEPRDQQRARHGGEHEQHRRQPDGMPTCVSLKDIPSDRPDQRRHRQDGQAGRRRRSTASRRR